jgi:hypothetical protein
MTSQLEVRQAVKARLDGRIRDVTYYHYVPAYPEAPCVWVGPAFPPVDFEQVYGGYAKWNLLITLVADWIDEETAQDVISEWIDDEGPVIGALLDTSIDDDLSRLSRDVRAMIAENSGEMTMGETKYQYAQVRVSVRA